MTICKGRRKTSSYELSWKKIKVKNRANGNNSIAATDRETGTVSELKVLEILDCNENHSVCQ